MRGSPGDIDLVGALITIIIIAIVLFVGLHIIGFDYQDPHETEHYNKSVEWCESENGSLALMNDAFQAEHNGFHCITDSHTFHMHQIQEINYTHNMETIKNNCGTTHQNTPFFIGCGFGSIALAVLIVIILVVTVVKLVQYGPWVRP